ncbi:MAG: peptidoglycan DD-metalloendopeptidase family protein [Patescibacteria group bacterium]
MKNHKIFIFNKFLIKSRTDILKYISFLYLKFKIIFTFLIIFFIFTFFLPAGRHGFLRLTMAAAPSELKESIDQKSRELQEIGGKIKENQKNLEEIQGQSKTLGREVNKIDYNIKQADLGIRSSEVIVDKLGLEINSIGYDIDDAEKSIVSKKEAIIKIIQEFQQKDDESFLIIFLKNKSLAESVFEAQNLTDISNSLSMEIIDLSNIKTILADKLKETADKKEITKIEQENLKNKKIILNDLKDDKQIVLKQTKNQEQIYQKLIGDLEKKQAEIAIEIDKLEEALRISFDPNLLPVKRPGVLGYPTKDILITQEYGKTAFAQRAYKTKFHNGIDFKAPIGTPIYAAEDGQVFAVGNNGKIQYGRFVVIKHNNNLATLYAHLSRQIVKEGNSIKKGDIIGYSGNTGYSFGPHIHFVVYWALSLKMQNFPGAGLVPIGVTINPTDYL